MEDSRKEEIKETICALLDFVHPRHLEILQILYLRGEHSYEALCKKLEINKSSLVFLLEKLQTAELVNVESRRSWRLRKQHSGHITLKQVTITDKGKRILNGLFGVSTREQTREADWFTLTFEVLRYIRRKKGKTSSTALSEFFSMPIRMLEDILRLLAENGIIEMSGSEICLTVGGRTVLV